MNLDLKGKNALVCGSTQGLGLASAIELAKLGAKVTLMARNGEKLIEVVEYLQLKQILEKQEYIPEQLKTSEIKKQLITKIL